MVPPLLTWRDRGETRGCGLLAEALGSLCIVNVNGRADAKAFSDGDPFTLAGVFESISSTPMRQGQWNPDAAEGA